MAKRRTSKLDPTRTSSLRAAFSRQLRKSFRRLKGRIVKYLVVDNELALNATPTQMRFATSPEKLKAFQTWIKQELKDELLSDEQAWARYIQQGFLRGSGRAFDDAKSAKRAAGAKQSEARGEFLRDTFGRAETREKAQLLASRSFTDLENVTEDMATKMGRVLTDGLVSGANPRALAADLEDVLDSGRNRAETIARTEIVRAHSEGQLDAFERLGVEEIGVMVEWSTAGDDRVCDACSELEGIVLRVAEAHGMIPRHPNCRCAFVPANVGEDDEDQIRGKAAIERVLGETDTEPGADISRTRPRSILNAALAFDEVVNRSFFADCDRDERGRCMPGGGTKAGYATAAEQEASVKIARAKIKSAPVPGPDRVAKMRAALERVKTDPNARAGGDARGNSYARRARAEALFKEFGGDKKGYVVCPWSGLKMHYSSDPKLNPKGYPKFEQGKIFTARQGGGYQMPNLIPESFTANRSRNAKPVRKENLT